MPIFKREGRSKKPIGERNLSERIKLGKVVPLISDEIIVDLVLGGYDRLITDYASHIDYPLEQYDGLLKLAKFRALQRDMDDFDLKSEFLDLVKTHTYYLAEGAGIDENTLEEAAEEADRLSVSEFADRLGYPKFKGEQDPLLILADLPLPIYLTTSPYSFIETALKKAGKTPRTEICRWRSALESLPSVFDETDYQPSPDEPLVYHLHGCDTNPDSLVLTEDDYLEYLVNISQVGSSTDPIPRRVRQAMSDSALMLLGYPLPSWPFRVLFWGLIKPASMNHTGIFVLELEANDIEKKYLTDYLKKEDIEAQWMKIETYVAKLKGMG